MKKCRLVAVTLVVAFFLTCFNGWINPRGVKASEALSKRKADVIEKAADYLYSNGGKEKGSFFINSRLEAATVLKIYSNKDKNEINKWFNGDIKTSDIDLKARLSMAKLDSESLDELFKNQNNDGGFGLSDEYESDILDSILVLEALNVYKFKYDERSIQLVNYIARQMNSDGTYSYTKNTASDDILTAMALYSVSRFMNENNITSDLTSGMRSKVRDSLIPKYSSSFTEENLEEKLYISLALDEANSLNDYEEFISSLEKIQNEDGSFYNDIHLTSLVIWVLGNMDTDNLINIYDIAISNTSQAYYGIDNNIDVDYTVYFDAKMDSKYEMKAIIKNGDRVIAESEPEEVTFLKNDNKLTGKISGLVINENSDDGIKVYIQIMEGDKIIKESKDSQIIMCNLPRNEETSIDDFSIELSDHYSFVGEEALFLISYKINYSTNVDNSLLMIVQVSKDGEVLKEESYEEILLPEKEYNRRDAYSYEADSSEKGEYTVTVKCLYNEELLFEDSDKYYVLEKKSVKTEDDKEQTEKTETPSDAPIESIIEPFSIRFMNIRLTDSIGYIDEDKEISVGSEIAYGGNETFNGTLETEITLDDKLIDSFKNEVTLVAGEEKFALDEIGKFIPDSEGKYHIKMTLYDKDFKEIGSTSRDYKALSKKKLDLIANSKISSDEKQTVDLRWNNISNSEERYNYRLYRRYDGTDWVSRSIWNEEDKIKVLNVYPYKPYLKDWMTTTISGSETPAGMGMFEIDSVYHNDFNSDPEKYLLDDQGRWKYDVIFFGASDGNDSKDISKKAYEVTRKFVDTGRGVLFGHDTVCLNNNNTNYAKFADDLGIKVIADSRVYPGNRATVVKYGTLTNYPWVLRGTMSIPNCHSWGQYVGGNLDGTEWMSINATQFMDGETKAHSNSYLVTNNNFALIQTGHTTGWATDDERKILANTLFYLHQTSQVTTAKDSSFYDLAAPETPEVEYKSATDNVLELKIKSNDKGTKYQYYIEALSNVNKDDNSIRSNIMTEEAISGIKGYVIKINDSDKEDKSIIEYDSNNERIVNYTLADEDGNLTTYIDLSEGNEGSYLHIYAVDNEDNVSEERIVDLREGYLDTLISTDKAEYKQDEMVNIKAETEAGVFDQKADVSIALYDAENHFIKEVYYDNNQAVEVDEVNIIETELTAENLDEGGYILKISWSKANEVVATSSAGFKVTKKDEANPDVPEDIDPEIKNPDIENENKVEPVTEDTHIKASDGNVSDDNTDKAPEQSNTPKTGDVNLWGYVIMMFISAIAVIFILKGKSKKDEI